MVTNWSSRRVGPRDGSSGAVVTPYGAAPRVIKDVYRPSVDTVPEIQAARRRLTSEAAVAKNRAHPHVIERGRDDEAARRFARWRVLDPFPEVPPALLNSADIADYACATGMIYPFIPTDLKSASLRLRVEGEFRYFDGDGSMVEGNLLPSDDAGYDEEKFCTELVIPGNSIVFVSVGPRIRLPDYIAMRFNLKIDHVYKGLLLGTGPLVDPGFDGILHIPIHNLTQEDYVLKAGDGLIWAEFTKVSPSALFSARAPENPERMGAYVPFAGKEGAHRGIMQYIRDAVGEGKRPRSSLPALVAKAQDAAAAAYDAGAKIDATVEAVDATISRARLINFAVAFSIFVTASLPIGIFFFQTRGELNTVENRNSEMRALVDSQNASIAALQAKIAALESQPPSQPTVSTPSPSAGRP